MIIVHLAGMWNYRDRMSFGQCRDFSGLCQPTDSIRVELNVINRARLNQFPKSIKRKFMFATGYGERGLPEAYRNRPTLKKPFQLEGLKQMLQSALDGGSN